MISQQHGMSGERSSCFISNQIHQQSCTKSVVSAKLGFFNVSKAKCVHKCIPYRSMPMFWNVKGNVEHLKLKVSAYNIYIYMCVGIYIYIYMQNKGSTCTYASKGGLSRRAPKSFWIKFTKNKCSNGAANSLLDESDASPEGFPGSKFRKRIWSSLARHWPRRPRKDNVLPSKGVKKSGI